MERKAAVFLVLKMDRWAAAIEAVAKAGLQHEAWGLLRVQIEHFVHLHFIYFAGPTLGKDSASNLAERYLEYAHYKNWTVIRQAWGTDAFAKTLRHKTPKEILGELRTKCRMSFEADKRHHFSGRGGRRAASWTPHTYPVLLKWALQTLPYYVCKEVREILEAETARSLQSSWLHTDSFADKRFTEEIEGGVHIKEEWTVETMPAEVASLLAYYGWMVLGELLGFSHDIEKRFFTAVHTAPAKGCAS